MNNEKNDTNRPDTADKALSEALRISFIILKFIMIVLVVIFLASGLRTVGSDEQALVLRFGKFRGVGENRVLNPGFHWLLPYPIDEIIKIPVEKKPSLPIESFWYYQDPSELLSKAPGVRFRAPEKLNPIRDGYCISRSEKEQTPAIAGSDGSDYNIVHCRGQLIYEIYDPERFFKNIYVRTAKPGEIYFDVIKESISPLLQYLTDDAIVTALVNYTIDEAISSQAKIPEHVKKLLQQKLDEIESGIRVVSVQLTDITWPRQLDVAFLDSIKASQQSQRLIKQAETYAEKTLNEAAGPVAEQLLTALNDKTVSPSDKELLWSQLAGDAQGKIAQARGYRTTVVEAARANAEYFQKLLPEYRKHPKLVVQKIYQDAIEYVLNNADEKIIIQPAKGTKERQIRILINRDPAIKPKLKQE